MKVPFMRGMKITLVALVLTASAPALAHTLVSPGPTAKIAKSTMSAVPDSEWNRLRERGGKNVEVWTVDGDGLNKLMFFGGVPSGKTIVREEDKRDKPLPTVSATMLLTDVPTLLEQTYRAQFNVNRMSVDKQEATELGGHKAIRFAYSFVRQDDEVERRGEAVATLAGGRLFMVLFEAPSLYYFDRDVDRYRRLVSTVKF